jgi:RNA polymerase sigma factor (sigma-70 family)
MTPTIQPHLVPEPLLVPGDQELSQLGRAAYRQARRFGAGREDAEDIAQDVMTLLVAGHAVINPWHWMPTVVRNGVFRLYRQALKPQPLEECGEAFDHDPWGRRELWLDVSSAFERLRPRERSILRMSLCGYSEREIAAASNCSIKAVEKSLHASRRRLRSCLVAGNLGFSKVPGRKTRGC